MNSERVNENASPALNATMKAIAKKQLRLSMDGQTLQFVGGKPSTPKQEAALKSLNIALDEAVQLALDAACFRIQTELGQKHGDFASMHFATGGPQEAAVRSCFATYLIDEVEQVAENR